LFKRPVRWAYAALTLLLLVGIWFPFVGYNLEAHVTSLRVEPLFTWLYGNFSFFTWQTRTYSLLLTAIVLVLAWRGPRFFLADPPETAVATPAPPERESPPRPAPSWASTLAPLAAWLRAEPQEKKAASTGLAARILPMSL